MITSALILRDAVKRAIFEICTSFGYSAKEEYGEKGWRTDV